jgi:hypothetical protein
MVRVRIYTTDGNSCLPAFSRLALLARLFSHHAHGIAVIDARPLGGLLGKSRTVSQPQRHPPILSGPRPTVPLATAQTFWNLDKLKSRLSPVLDSDAKSCPFFCSTESHNSRVAAE